MIHRVSKSSKSVSMPAFTLSELIVLLATLAVLVIILLPSLTAARNRSQNSVCLSNLAQLSTIFTMYSNDFNDWLCPPEDTYIAPGKWNDPYNTAINVPYSTLIRRYTHDPLIRDPDNKSLSAAQRQWSPISGNVYGGSTVLECPGNPNLMYYTFSVHYGMNSFPWVYAAQNDPKTNFTQFNPSWWKRNQVVAPSKVMQLAESDASGGGLIPYTQSLYGHRIPNNFPYFGKWHDNGTNILFFDGHVEWWPAPQLNAACAGNITGPPWYASMVTVSGAVDLQSFNGDKPSQPVTIEVRNPGQQESVDSYSATLDAAGNYSIQTPWKGSYDLTVKASHWLRNKRNNITIDRPGPVTVNFSLTNGDCDGDNEVTSTDDSLILAAVGAVPGDANWDANADLDGDMIVTGSDLSIVLASMDLSGSP